MTVHNASPYRDSTRARASAALVAGIAALVLPQGAARAGSPSVAGGAATIATGGTSTIVNQTTPRLILNWPSLSVPAGGMLQFIQPNGASIALNRVTGGGTSFINGSLLANGQVWIVNPAGVLFGRGASVNVAGLIATTSDISDQNFLAGNYAFSQPSAGAGAAVVNRGTIDIAPGGAAVLAAPHVANSGVIEATLGSVVLAGGNAFTVDFQGDKLLTFQIAAPVAAAPLLANGSPAAALVENSGTLSTPGGTVLLTARAARSVVTHAINTTGLIEAVSAHEEDGAIVLDAGGGDAHVSGTLDVSGKAAGETGGTVSVTGSSVALDTGAVIDASGDRGGGSVAIGGNLHGAGPLANADQTTVAQGARIDASAITAGNGGIVSVWSNGTTIFDGSITVHGGAQGGNGGMVETSGEGTLVVGSFASVTAAAPAGTGGSWLLDPSSNVNITNSTSGVTCSGSGTATCSPTADGSSIDAAVVIGDLNGGTNVTINTNNATGTQAGTITVSSPIAVTGSTAVALELDATSDINVNAAITSSNAPLSVTLNATNSGAITIAQNVTTNGGTVTAGAGSNFTVNTGASITTTGGVGAGGGVSLGANGGSFTLNGGLTAAGGGLVQASVNVVLGASSSIVVPGTSNLTLVAGPAGSITQTQGSTISLPVDGSVLGLNANSITLAALAGGTPSITGNGFIGLAGATAATTIGIGTGAGTLNISQTSINAIGAGDLLIGNFGNQTGTITFGGGVSIPIAVDMNAGGVGGSIAFAANAVVTFATQNSVNIFANPSGSITEAQGATIAVPNSSGFLNFYANSMTLVPLASGAPSITGNGHVSLAGTTAVTTIGVGSGAGTLAIGQTTLNAIGTRELDIGFDQSNTSGPDTLQSAAMNVTGPVTFPIPTVIGVASGGGTAFGTGPINLSGTITSTATTPSQGGGFTFFLGFIEPTVLAGATTINTTAGVASGGTVVFDNTIDDAAGTAFANTLTVTAGAGDVDFTQRVGFDPTLGGVPLGAVSITTTGAVNLTMPSAGFDAAAFTANAGSISATAGYVSTHGESGGTIHPNGGAINITTAGNVSIGGEVNSGGGINTTTNAGGNGGAITINAGGTVAIGTALVLTTSGSGAALVTTNNSVFSGGFDATTAPQTPGNGAAIAITGTTIDLPLGVISRGGEEEFAGSATAGGNGAPITLTANSGGVTVGIATGPNATGNAALVDAVGGNTPAGNVGAGAAVTIQGTTISLSKVISSAGSSAAASGTAASGGAITLIATAASGPAVTLYGEHDVAATSTPSFATLGTRGSVYGATALNAIIYTGGTVTGTGGNITIESSAGGAPLNGTSYIQLATGTPNSLNGGSTIEIGGGVNSIKGPIEATTVGPSAESMHFVGTTTVTGPVGDLLPLGTLALNFAGVNFPDTFQGPVTANTLVSVLHNTATVIFDGFLSTPQITMAAGSATLELLGGATITVPSTFSGGPIDLAGTLSTPGLALNFPSTVTIEGATTIDTTNGGVVPTGAPVTFTGTLGGASAYLDDLTIRAGSTGNVAFSTATGTRLGAVTIASANAVTMNGNLSAASFAIVGPGNIPGAVSLTTTGAAGINTAGATSPTLPTTGGAVDIVTSGAVTVAGSINANGGVNTATNVGSDGGTVTINAGGAVTIGNGIALTTSGSGDTLLVTSAPSISANGFTLTAAAQTAGDGGDVMVTGSSITMARSVSTNGGNAEIAGSAQNAGSAGSVSLDATAGNVTIGSAATGNAIQVSALGGGSVGGAGGNGGNVTISGTTLSLSRVTSTAGDAEDSIATASTARNITLLATATSGDAVVIYGNALSPAIGGTLISTFGALGGVTGDTNLLTLGALPNGLLSGPGGNITIEGTLAGGPLRGTSVVRLVDNSAAGALNGGPTVTFTTSGGTGGTIFINGPVVGTTTNTENLHLSAANGVGTVAGTVGTASIALNNVVVGPASNVPATLPPGSTSGAFTFQAAVTAGTQIQDTGTSGSLTFDGLVTTPLFTMAAGSTNLALLAGASFTGPVTLASGPVSLAGGFTFTGAATGIDITGATTLAGATTIDSSAVTGALTLGAVTGTAAGADDLTLHAGSAPISLGTVGATPLASLTATGGIVTLNGSVTTSGVGGINLSGATGVTLGTTTTLTSSNAPVTLGAVNAAAAGAQGLTVNAGTGAIALGTVGATTLSSLTATGGTIALNGPVTTTGAQSYTGTTTLNTDEALTTANAAITMGAVNAATAGGEALTLNAGTGAISLGTVGATALSSLTATGATIALNGNVTTTGSQTYTGAVAIAAGGATLTGVNLSFNGSIDGPGALTLADPPPPGTILVTGNIGTNSELSGLAASAGTIDLEGSVETSGSQSYTTSGGNIVLGNSLAPPGAVDPLGTSGGAMSFNGPAMLNQNVALNTAQGGAAAGGPVTFTSTISGAPGTTLNITASNVTIPANALNGVTETTIITMAPPPTNSTTNSTTTSDIDAAVQQDLAPPPSTTNETSTNSTTSSGPADQSQTTGTTTETTTAPNSGNGVTTPAAGTTTTAPTTATTTSTDIVSSQTNSLLDAITPAPSGPTTAPTGAGPLETLASQTTGTSTDTTISGGTGTAGTGTGGGPQSAGAPGTADSSGSQQGAGSTSNVEAGGLQGTTSSSGSLASQTTGAQAAATTAANNAGGADTGNAATTVAFTVTGSEATPDAGTETDSVTSSISQSLGSGPGQSQSTSSGQEQSTSRQTTTTRTVPIIGGLLVETPPRQPPQSTSHGVPPADQEYSSWGNEAFWQ
ncbi:MAG TPA: filamentous hemagglutinin N-terminal domain-containing protein [Stellaceae bacterium]|nr:filamentous hemagglutinin N-terminal domain-containing protein [Stellaceae bacterium]